MGIDSKEKFIRSMVEIGFERVSADEGTLTYAYSPTYEDGEETRSTLWIYHFEQEYAGGVVYLQIQTKDFFGLEKDSKYTKIFDVVKEKCDYESLIENPFVEGDEMVSYGCEWEDTAAKETLYLNSFNLNPAPLFVLNGVIISSIDLSLIHI